MSNDHKTVFISYSWDNKEHEQWVMDLANDLRRNGVDATLDKFETQTKTVNLNQMMNQNMNRKDYVIIVLTENYAKKANDGVGGVGFETMISFPILQQNPDKFIIVVRSYNNFEEAFPFHLRGFYAIDFSDGSNYEEKFKELLHRIEKVPLHPQEPLGEKPVLTPQNVRDDMNCTSEIQDHSEDIFRDIEIPNLKRITDLDKDKFLEQSYVKINNYFVEIFDKVKKANPNFHYTKEQVTEKKHVYQLYVDGEHRTGVKIWLGNSFGKGIHLVFGNRIDPFNDNQMNDIIRCEVTHDNEMILKMTFNMYGGPDSYTPEEIVRIIWENRLKEWVK